MSTGVLSEENWKVCGRCGRTRIRHYGDECKFITADEFAEERRASFAKGIGWSLSRLITEACSGVAALYADADRKLLQVRGYLVFPEDRLFMEHWWCRNGDTIIDPLSQIGFRGRSFERVEVGAGRATEYEDVGSFDCLALTGRCDREKRNNPPCEWCVTRKALEKKGMIPYELAVSVELRSP